MGRRWAAMMAAFLAALVLAGLAGAWRLPLFSRTDLALSRGLQRLQNPTLDLLMEGATWLGSGVVLPGVALLAAAALWALRRVREALGAAASLLALPLNYLLKSIADRPRPVDPVEVMTRTFGTSFPSGHSMGSAAVYGTLAAIVWTLPGGQRWSFGLLAIPVAVGISRVYLGAHWGYDVMAGWAAGALCVAGIVAWLRQGAKSVDPA